MVGTKSQSLVQMIKMIDTNVKNICLPVRPTVPIIRRRKQQLQRKNKPKSRERLVRGLL
jgi:hypothetical protein